MLANIESARMKESQYPCTGYHSDAGGIEEKR
jgi:hypothetical protein